jgi:hypothetical protein
MSVLNEIHPPFIPVTSGPDIPSIPWPCALSGGMRWHVHPQPHCRPTLSRMVHHVIVTPRRSLPSNVDGGWPSTPRPFVKERIIPVDCNGCDFCGSQSGHFSAIRYCLISISALSQDFLKGFNAHCSKVDWAPFLSFLVLYTPPWNNISVVPTCINHLSVVAHTGFKAWNFAMCILLSLNPCESLVHKYSDLFLPLTQNDYVVRWIHLIQDRPRCLFLRLRGQHLLTRIFHYFFCKISTCKPFPATVVLHIDLVLISTCCSLCRCTSKDAPFASFIVPNITGWMLIPAQ